MSEARNTKPMKRTGAAKPEIEENSIGPARRRARALDPPAPGAPQNLTKPLTRPKQSEDKRPVPEDVRRRFVQLKNEYFFPDGAKAFTDRGDRLTTQSENTEVIRSLITIAQSRGWGEVR